MAKFDWNRPFSKENLQNVDSGHTETKKDEVVLGDTEIKILPSFPLWKTLFRILLALFVLCAGIYALTFHLPNLGRTAAGIMSLPVGLSILLVMIVLYVMKLKPPAMDDWIKDIAKKMLSTKYIFFRGKTIYVHYDVNLHKKDIMDFANEMNSKSERFTYYVVDIDVNTHTVIVEITKKKEIPKRCTIDVKEDTVWNFVPMGKALNHEERDITDIGWYINGREKAEHAVKTNDSPHMLIAGGTGSGKSVVENGIIGHITRHPDHFQGLLCDVKMVEFNQLDQYAGIHKVALTIEGVQDLLSQVQRIMMKRFGFVKDQCVQNIYDVKLDKVDHYVITGEDGKEIDMQFDEIIPCKVNGKSKLLTIEEIYDELQDGSTVEVEPRHLVVD